MHESRIEEVLAPCVYEELQRLKEQVNAAKDGSLYAWYEEHMFHFEEQYEKCSEINEQLRLLLKECNNFIYELPIMVTERIEKRREDLLTCINEVLK